VMPAPITLERVRTQNIVTSERKIRWEESCSGNSTQRKFGLYVGRVRESNWRCSEWLKKS
jgi:hypothetical protein